jgi:hypothetical protein
VVQSNLVNSKLYNSKFHNNFNFCFNLGPKEETFIQIYQVISETLSFVFQKKNVPCIDNFHTILPMPQKNFPASIISPYTSFIVVLSETMDRGFTVLKHHIYHYTMPCEKNSRFIFNVYFGFLSIASNFMKKFIHSNSLINHQSIRQFTWKTTFILYFGFVSWSVT